MLFSALIGSISFSGSLVAFGKLQEVLPGRPITYTGQQVVNALLFAVLLGSVSLAGSTEQGIWMVLLLLGALLFGVLLVLPIGGADMPVVISLLNAFTGLAAASAGFVLENTALIIGGHARRRLGHAPHRPHGPGDEPLDRQRPLRRVRGGAGRRRCGSGLDGREVLP